MSGQLYALYPQSSPSPLWLSVYKHDTPLTPVHKPERFRAGDFSTHGNLSLRSKDGDAGHAIASSPFFCTKASSFNDGPCGCFSPRSHLLTNPVVTLR